MNKDLSDYYVNELWKCAYYQDHIKADQLLLELLNKLGYSEVINAFNNIEVQYFGVDN
jgi:hypothetical protein